MEIVEVAVIVLVDLEDDVFRRADLLSDHLRELVLEIGTEHFTQDGTLADEADV